ncbi:MAG: bacteriohemerythrin [Lachnospiraceae bacterium]
MFEFTDDCKIGIDLLDEEHKYLFQLLNDAHILLTEYEQHDYYEDLKNIFEKLDMYAEQHFSHEEAYMEKICDPELILQRSQHAFFRDQILMLDLKNIDEKPEQLDVLDHLVTFLAKWLYRHILGSDILIGKLPPLEKWMLKENPCEFTDEYLIGIDLIDREHEELFHIIGETEELLRSFQPATGYDKIMDLLAQLTAYTKEHFQDEEEYMEQIHYKNLPAQKRAHEAFIGKLEDIDRNELEHAPEENLHELLEFLLGWLINHILNTDKKIPVKE